jgi:hypothetical protein
LGDLDQFQTLFYGKATIPLETLKTTESLSGKFELKPVEGEAEQPVQGTLEVHITRRME